MTINYKYVAAGVAILASFAFGRYSVKTVTTQVVQTQKTDIKVNQDSKVDDNKTTTITVKPDGTKTTVITDNKKTDTKTDSNTQSVTDTKSTTTSGSNSGGSSFILSASAGIDITSPSHLVYGLEASNKLIGPIRIGVFGMTNGLLGASLGLQF